MRFEHDVIISNQRMRIDRLVRQRDAARLALQQIAEQTIVYVAGTHEPTYDIALRMRAIASAALDALRAEDI